VRQKRIAIVSVEDDLHALIVQKALERYADVECHVIESNRICSSGILNWSNAEGYDLECRVPTSRVPTRGGEVLDVHCLDIIWWRRVGYPQQIPSFVTDPAHIDLINNDCRVGLVGLLLNEFPGTWINHPINTQLAENKLVQLRAAQRVGFRVPRTLVSQDPAAIRDFCEQLDHKVVVKAVSGTSKVPLFTTMLTPDHLACDDSMSLCPAIYQEYIPGERHVRIQCFGDAVNSVTVRSQDLDWRANLNVPFEVIELAEDIKTRLRNVLKLLGLKMGVVDLKFTQDGEPVWFEINPQGQFLFVEGLSGLDLTSPFADFLYQEARQASTRV
jgi:hypothetical protein